ncbi:MAG: helix-turn-helix domain-containing protein [Cytophagales bacterium]|nr:helix-turn-helix domain-containing protein [Cytophagales bacterium]
MHLDVASILGLFTIGQALFLAFSFSTIKAQNKLAAFLLIAIVFALAWYQTEFLAIRNRWEIPSGLFFGTRYGSWLLLGPLLYCYSKASCPLSWNFNRKAFLHFVPFLVFVVILPFLTHDLHTWRSVDYGLLTVFDHMNREPITFWQYVYGTVAFGQFIHLIIYALLAYRNLHQCQIELQKEYSNLLQKGYLWQRMFFLFTIIIVSAVGTFIGFQFITGIYRRHADYFYVVPLSLAIYCLMYQAIKFPQLFFDYAEELKPVRYEKSSLSPNASKAYIQKVVEAVESQSLYINRELRLTDVAKQLEMSPNHLSQVINENLQKNFFDFINQYRVTEAKKKIAEEPDKTLLQIAHEVGFNNKTSFNNAFKKHQGMTPSSYRGSLT